MADIALTPDEQSQLLSLLSKVEPGFYPIELFWEFARLMTTSILEFVPLRVRDDKIEVLLIPRSDDDRFWSGGVHIPGCVVRPNDTQQIVFDRIAQDELQGTAIKDPKFLHAEIRKSKRGTEQAQIFWVEVTGDPKIGTFVPVDSLPDNLVEDQHKLVHAAAEAFVNA